MDSLIDNVKELFKNTGISTLKSNDGANWKFEKLHKSAKQKKLGGYAIKSRERGNMPYFERLYFCFENDILTLCNITHIWIKVESDLE